MILYQSCVWTRQNKEPWQINSNATLKIQENIQRTKWGSRKTDSNLETVKERLKNKPEGLDEDQGRLNRLIRDLQSKFPKYVKQTFYLRVWSWLRMNAGGVLNTCKSNGPEELAPKVSGGRVSNAWVTCLIQGDNSWKRLLIPHNTIVSHGTMVKLFGCEMGPRLIS